MSSGPTKLEKLLLCQVVVEKGNAAWPAVLKLLQEHPLLPESEYFADESVARGLYEALMAEAGLDPVEVGVKAKAKAHIKLAKDVFVDRVLELRAEITAEEAKFK